MKTLTPNKNNQTKVNHKKDYKNNYLSLIINKMRCKNQYFCSVLIFTLSLVSLICITNVIADEIKTSLIDSYKDKIIDVILDLNKINAPEIIAENAVVYDVSNENFIYAKAAEETVPMASLAKIITATVFLQINAIRKTMGNEVNNVIIVKNNKGYNQGDRDLINGEKWRVQNIIRYMLITSSNIAAQSLVKSIIDDEFAFSLLMNKTVKDFGFKSFDFKNSSGLPIYNYKYNLNDPDSSQFISSANGSAKEIALLFNLIFEKMPFLGDASVIPEAKFINLSGNTHNTKNVNQSLTQVPHIVAGKTGTTDESGGNVMVTIEINRNKYVIVVLGSTPEGRYQDVMALASSTEAFATLK